MNNYDDALQLSLDQRREQTFHRVQKELNTNPQKYSSYPGAHLKFYIAAKRLGYTKIANEIAQLCAAGI